MRLTTLKKMYYGMRSMIAGEYFDASEKDARLLILARAAAEAPPEVVFDEAEGELPKQKRRYKRRDMQADE
jgi:hypothetical protein